MGQITTKATILKASELKSARRGRKPVINDELVADLVALLKPSVAALDLAVHFGGSIDTSDKEVTRKIGQNVRKHWALTGKASTDLRLDFIEGRVQAQVRKPKAVKAVKAEVSAPELDSAENIG